MKISIVKSVEDATEIEGDYYSLIITLRNGVEVRIKEQARGLHLSLMDDRIAVLPEGSGSIYITKSE